MARDGYKIFDSDTHVGPFVNVLEPHLDEAVKAKLPAWEEFRTAHHKTGHITYTKGQRKYRRRLGTAKAEDTPAGYMAGFTGPERDRNPDPEGDINPAKRIADMDYEGVDANLMLPSGWFGTWTTGDDVKLEMGMYEAYHRWMDDYTKDYKGRLGSVMPLSARDPQGSVEIIKRWGKAHWAWGILVYAPAGSPLDHPDIEPIWKAAADHDLSITLHTFTVMPPYSPGGLDNWENLWLQRSAAHPWCGMRNMASVIGAGVMDRYPDIRLGTLEAGHGWLPFWMARLDEHYNTIRSALPPELKHKPSDYVLGGRYYQSIEIPEGDKLTNSVMDLIGDEVLMYASDYPHTESHFPKSVELVLDWDMSKERKQKLFWDNAVRFYARSGLK